MTPQIKTYRGDGGWHAETRIPQWGTFGKWSKSKRRAVERLREYVKQWEPVA
jgi:hypothetical protein